ncbi:MULTISPECIES: hypothetical protein [unclassified Pseudoclavibacter]|uniref:hypothetical protein n=1 Tax=unclassified Pseudoclavibacter TaxID=2615177 RepID=UPI001BAA7855|nr:hypothetical protein [Pseudoclavibacter sp. Marseille-Q4354]MBS3178773.1 hypothetical protein [Pseudoclavibacter sp. Marseille-Q4354]
MARIRHLAAAGSAAALLTTLVIATPPAGADEAPSGQIVPVTLSEEGYETTAFAYVPDVAEYGERATASPLIVVYGDAPYTADSALQTAEDGGFAQIAADERSPILFVNPANGSTWTDVDERSLVVSKRQFSDSTNLDYTTGTTAGTSDTGLFPGSRFRTYVFADGTGADFAHEHLYDGVEDVHPYVSAWPATYFPSAIYTSNATASVVTGSTEAEVPGYLVNGTAAMHEAITGINTSFGTAVAATSPVVDGFDAASVSEGYSEVLSTFMRRDSWVAPHTSSLVPLTDYAALGIEMTRDVIEVQDARVEYFTYTPDSVATATVDSTPVVFLFHGNGNHAEAQASITEWPRIGAEEGFITVSVQDHAAVGMGDERMRAALDSILETIPQADSTRIYASGFSMGGRQSWSLGALQTELFAGIAPTNGVFAPPASTNDLRLPTFYAGAPLGPFDELPSKNGTASTVDETLASTFAKNGITDSYTFDAEADPVWGIAPDRTARYTSPYFEVQTDVNYYADADGQEMVALAINHDATHEPLSVTTEAAWDFLQDFSRAADGSIVIGDPVPTAPPETTPPATTPPATATATQQPTTTSTATAAPTPPAPQPTGTEAGKPDSLATTGSELTAPLVIVALLLVLGAGAVLLSRRRAS